MANTLMDNGRAAFAKGGVDWLTDSIKVVLVSGTYSFPGSGGASWLSDVPSGDQLGTSGPLTGTSVAAGVVDAADLTGAAGIGPVAAGNTVTGFYVYKDTGTPGTSPLLCWFDTLASGAAINVPTNGGNIEVQWATTGNKIFAI